MSKEFRKHRHLEADIKALVLNRLKKSGHLSGETCIINEFAMGQVSGRLDIALISKGKILAFEIKSEADSLRRLENQLSTYQKHFDKVTIVADTKHIEKILAAVPLEVAVWEVYDNQIRIKRRGRFSPVNSKTALLHLLKVSELKKSCAKLTNSTQVASRKAFISALVNVPMHSLRAAVLSHLRSRFLHTTNKFLSVVGKRDILPKDIALLSPYRDQRHKQAEKVERRQIMLKNLSQPECDDPHLLELARSTKQNLFGNVPEKTKILISD